MFINEIIDTGKTEEAMGYLKKFETKKNPELMFLNAKILYLNGNYQDSEKMLKEIDKKSPFAPEALFLLIDINLKKSMIKEAQIYYVKLLTLFPKTVWAQKAQAMMAKYKKGR
jgi:predicted Zn-dependent protease